MSQSLREALNAGQPNQLGIGARDVEMGNALGAAVRFVRSEVDPATGVMSMPNTAKGQTLFAAFRAVGTAEGPCTIVAGSPGAGEAAVSATGDILFAAVDAVTVAEVYYCSQQGETALMDIPVDPAVGIAYLPSGMLATGVIYGNVTQGGALGQKTVLRRGSTPAPGACALSFEGGAVEFDVADAVERVQVYLVKTPAPSVSDLLEGQTNLL